MKWSLILWLVFPICDLNSNMDSTFDSKMLGILRPHANSIGILSNMLG